MANPHASAPDPAAVQAQPTSESNKDIVLKQRIELKATLTSILNSSMSQNAEKMSIWLQKTALIQPRVSLSKFADAYMHHAPPVMNSALPNDLTREALRLVLTEGNLARLLVRGAEEHGEEVLLQDLGTDRFLRHVDDQAKASRLFARRRATDVQV